MRREHIHNPDDFDSIDGKVRVIKDSLDGLLDGTERFRVTRDPMDLFSAITSSLIILHQVVEGMLETERRCT